MDVFDMNCRRESFNAEYNRLQQLLHDGVIDSNHFINELGALRNEYQDLLVGSIQKG